MSSQINTLLAGKFMTLALSLFLSFVVIIKRQYNLDTSKYSSMTTAEQSLTACIVLTLVCQFTTFLSTIMGFSVFFDKINVFSITFQGLGVLFTSWYILGNWPSELLWPIWVFGSLIPFIFEVFVIAFRKKLFSGPIYIESE